MISDAFRILIRDHYISRLWSWISGYAVLLIILGVILLYEQLGVLGPMRFWMEPWRLRWIGGAVYFASLMGVIASFALNLKMREDKLALKADLAILNPTSCGILPVEESLSELEQRAIIMLRRLSRLEGIQWSMAGWPGLLGTIWYIFSASSLMLLMYVAISMVANLYHRPSLPATEKLVAEYISRRSPPHRTVGSL